MEHLFNRLLDYLRRKNETVKKVKKKHWRDIITKTFFPRINKVLCYQDIDKLNRKILTRDIYIYRCKLKFIKIK